MLIPKEEEVNVIADIVDNALRNKIDRYELYYEDEKAYAEFDDEAFFEKLGRLKECLTTEDIKGGDVR